MTLGTYNGGIIYFFFFLDNFLLVVCRLVFSSSSSFFLFVSVYSFSSFSYVELSTRNHRIACKIWDWRIGLFIYRSTGYLGNSY